MARTAMVVWGGWEGHQPRELSELFAEVLREEGFSPEVSRSLDSFLELPRRSDVALVVPIWTMGQITAEQLAAVTEAVRDGVGIAGCHGGMCDSFREATEWQFMTGGQWVAHPGNDGVEYLVRITERDHPITAGIPDFLVRSEQYYLHTDPSNHVLAVTRFPIADGPHVPNGPFDMPVVWTRMYGKGRVFYSSIGHTAEVARQKEPLELCRRGFLWAARD
jgi:type 1 glutamine amidotransferase